MERSIRPRLQAREATGGGRRRDLWERIKGQIQVWGDEEGWIARGQLKSRLSNVTIEQMVDALQSHISEIEIRQVKRKTGRIGEQYRLRPVVTERTWGEPDWDRIRKDSARLAQIQREGGLG
jgi:hypothetical protein